MRQSAAGITLVELLVVLVLLGVLYGVSTLAFASLRTPPNVDAPLAPSRARGRAIETGQAVAVAGVLFLPDGRAVGPGIDGLTGEVTGADSGRVARGAKR